MSDILKQIQALQEQFSNLFEVEGLGEPSSEVPPSTNKLKKDIKTKNGKVELVSVENELFPYDGNKKEQFQQKVLDTINGMIQGTATLEDLLQIVRQKKAPVKESAEEVDVVEKWEKVIEGFNLLRVVTRANEKKGKKFINPNGISQKGLKKETRLQKIMGDKQKTQELAKKALEAPDSKSYNKKIGGNEPYVFNNSGSSLGLADKRALDKDINGNRAEERQINKSKGRHYRKLAKMNKSEALKEAMELMEDLFSTILKQPDEKQGSLVYKYHQAKNKENAGKDTYTQAKEEEKRKSKEEKGQEKTEQRKKYRGKSTEDWKQGRLMDQIAKNAAKLAKVSDPATAKAMRRNAQKEDLKEALEIMEAIINEVSDKTANSFLEKRVINAVNAWYNDDKLNKKEDDAVKALIKRKARQGKELSDEEKKRIGEALEIMQSLIEATPFETKRRIADKFKDKAMDMYNKAAEKDIENSKKKVELHKKIHQQGGDVPAFAEDKIDTFSDKPEVRKEQEEYNKLVDNGKKSGERVHKMNNFVNLVNYYKTPKNV